MPGGGLESPSPSACLPNSVYSILKTMSHWITAEIGMGSLGPFTRTVHESGFCFTHFTAVQRVACYCPTPGQPWHHAAMDALKTGVPWPTSAADPYNICADAAEFMAWLDGLQRLRRES